MKLHNRKNSDLHWLLGPCAPDSSQYLLRPLREHRQELPGLTGPLVNGNINNNQERKWIALPCSSARSA